MPYFNVDVDIDIDDFMVEVSNDHLLKELANRNLTGVKIRLDTSEVWDTLLIASDIARSKSMLGLADRLDQLRHQYAAK